MNKPKLSIGMSNGDIALIIKHVLEGGKVGWRMSSGKTQPIVCPRKLSIEQITYGIESSTLVIID